MAAVRRQQIDGAATLQERMVRLDRFVRRHRGLVLAAWVLLIVAAIPFAARQSDRLSGGGFAVNGSESAAMADAVSRELPDVPRSELGVLVVPGPETPGSQLRAGLARARRAAAQAPHVTIVPESAQRAEAAVARNRPALLPLALDVEEDGAIDVASDLRERLGPVNAGDSSAATYLVGEGALWDSLREVAKEDLATAEERGFPIVLLILVVAFGSLGAATLPVAIGLFSVLLTGAAIFFLSRALEMSVYVTNMASMIGIGVAVDYSLFVLARYREEVAAGRYRALARSRALATSGLAVVFSGVTVVVALAGLFLIDNQAIRSMAIGAIIVVTLSVIAAVTLLPVLTQRLGYSAFVRMRVHTLATLMVRSLRWRRRRRGSTRARGSGDLWRRWSMFIMRRPGITFVLAAGLLLALAVPVLSLEIGERTLQQLPRQDEARVGAEHAARAVGPGALAPVRVQLSFSSGGADSRPNRALVAELRRRIADDPAIDRSGKALAARGGGSALISAELGVGGESDEARAAVERLREALPALTAERATVRVGGVTASQVDTTDRIAGSMWKIIVWILALAFVVLLVLLRSPVLAAKAVIMNLLSVGAAYGVLVVVFQWGWLDGVLGFDALGRVGTLTPPLVLAVVFGLSMDYEIFLLTRIRERYEALGDTRLAVAEGLARSARTITSAALIMVSVFGVFVFTGVPAIKELGLGNAVAIAIDATVVRLTLVPATMVLLGRWNWWLPASLDRVLPRSLERAPESAAAAGG